MGESPITLTVQLTVKDLFRANLWFFIWRRWWLVLIIILVLALLALAPVLESSGPARDNTFANLKPLFYLILFWLISIPTSIYFASRSRFKEQKGLRQENRYIISDEGIRIEADSSSERMEWSHIYAVRETKGYLFFHISKTTRAIIPKRALPNEEMLRALRRMVCEHIQGKVRLLS
jgi:hypothetical protein